MAEFDIAKTSITDLAGKVTDYSVDRMTTDAAGEQEETYYDLVNASKHYGFYWKIPELKKSIDALAMWVSGKGWEADNRVTAILEGMTGWGEDSFESIINNLIICKKVFGDAFAEIIRNEKTGTLTNIKVLDPASIRIVAGRNGMIKRYEQYTKTGLEGTSRRKLDPSKILHLCNDRVADNIHGTSIIECVEWTILARHEAMTEYRQVLHRNVVPLRVIEVDTDDTTKRNTLISEYEDAIKKGEVLIVPKGTVEIKDSTISIQDPLGWIKALEQNFYIAVGIPKVILGGSEEFTEASSKIAYLTFEQVYSKEQRELEADLWNQLALRITFNKPVSLKNELLQSEEKNTGQVGFQPKDTTATMERE
jgi:hypothetical protein